MTAPGFVGRAVELQALIDALALARSGRGRLVAVGGDAGIGKTRLVEELIRVSALPPDRVLWGRCLEQAGSPSYWPPRLGEHLRASVRTGYLCVYAPDPANPIRWEL